MLDEQNLNAADDRQYRQASPTLIIGLGGTGAEVLSRVKDRFFSTLGSLERFPVVQYLWLDTDTVQANTSQWYRQNRDIAHQLRFKDSEKVELTVPDTEAYLAHLDLHPHLRRWVYPNLSSKRSINEGAGQIRAYGRLAFFVNIDKVRSYLQEAVRRVTAIDAARISTENGLNTNSESLNVIIVGSVAGGTGSGTFLDMAYLVRQQLKELSGISKVSLMGFMLMPSAFGLPTTMGRLYANGYAALKELNHYNYSPGVERQNLDQTMRRSSEHDFVTQWAPNEPAESIGLAPFDICYLVDGRNQAGAAAIGGPVNETVFSMIAENILHDFSMSEFGTRKRSTRDNLLKEIVRDARTLYDTDDLNTKLPKRHFAFGLATITFPYARVKRACAAKLGLDIVDYWLRQSDDELEAKDFLAQRFLANIQMEEHEGSVTKPSKHNVLDALYAVEGGRTVRHDVLNAVSEMIQTVKSEGDHKAGLPWGQILRDEVEKLDKSWSGMNTEDQKLWGSMVHRMRQNKRNYLSDLRERLQEQVMNLVNNEHRGIGFGMNVLDALDDHLAQEGKGYIDFWRKEHAQAADQVNSLRAVLEQTLTDIDDHWEMSNWHGLRGITLQKDLNKLQDAANELYQARARLFARVLGIEVAEAALQEISRDDQRGWRSRLNRLQRELTKLQQKLQGRISAYSDATPDPRQILLYEGVGDLERIYRDYVPNAEALAKQKNEEALRALGVALMDLSSYSMDHDAVCEKLMRAVEPHFASLEQDKDVLTLFNEKFPPRSEVWEQKLDQVVKACQPWVTWEQGLTGIRDRVGAEQRRLVLGIAKKTNDPGYNDFVGTVLSRFGGWPQEVVPINSRHEIVLYTEVAGFALCQMGSTKGLRLEYQKAITDGARDLHTDKRDSRFAEAVVLSPQERQEVALAARAYLLGCILRVIVPKDWPDYRGNVDITYRFMQTTPGLPGEPRYLGNENAVIPYLIGKKESLTRAVNDAILQRQSDLELSVESRIEYAAILRYWIKEYYAIRQLDVGNGQTQDVEPIERQVLRTELARVTQGSNQWDREIAAKAAAIGDRDGFTRINREDNRRVMNLPVYGAEEEAESRIM